MYWCYFTLEQSTYMTDDKAWPAQQQQLRGRAGLSEKVGLNHWSKPNSPPLCQKVINFLNGPRWQKVTHWMTLSVHLLFYCFSLFFPFHQSLVCLHFTIFTHYLNQWMQLAFLILFCFSRRPQKIFRKPQMTILYLLFWFFLLRAVFWSYNLMLCQQWADRCLEPLSCRGAVVFEAVSRGGTALCLVAKRASVAALRWRRTDCCAKIVIDWLVFRPAETHVTQWSDFQVVQRKDYKSC